VYQVEIERQPEQLAPRCGVEPTPGPAKLYLPGLSRINCTSSGSDLAGTVGLTTTTFGETATSVTGAKSLMGSYGTLAYRLGLTTKPVLIAIMV